MSATWNFLIEHVREKGTPLVVPWEVFCEAHSNSHLFKRLVPLRSGTYVGNYNNLGFHVTYVGDLGWSSRVERDIAVVAIVLPDYVSSVTFTTITLVNYGYYTLIISDEGEVLCEPSN